MELRLLHLLSQQAAKENWFVNNHPGQDPIIECVMDSQ